nr:uncharacterized protein LOC113729352 [Coffea arabica]
MNNSKNTAEMVEEKLDLVRRYLLQSLKGLEAKEKKLQVVQEIVRKSSEKLSLIRESMQQEEKTSHFLLNKGLKELEIRREKLGLIQENVMIRLEKLNEKELLIEGLFKKVELEVEQFQTNKKLVDECFEEIQFEERRLDDDMKELELIENLVERTENGIHHEKEGIKIKEKVLGLKKEELVAKENELVAREKILVLKEEELSAKEKELEAREKILSLINEPDLEDRELDSVQKSIEQGSKQCDLTNPDPSEEEQLDHRSRKREGTDKNGSCKSSKRCRPHVDFGGSFNSKDDNEVEQIAAKDIKQSGLADSRCDDHHESVVDATSDHKESDSESGPSEFAREEDNQILPGLGAIKGPYTNVEQIVCPGPNYTSNSNPIDYSKWLINDFNDEDKLKRLAAGQTWATYGEIDDLPRSYFLVVDVFESRDSSLAKLRVLWLQPLPNYRAWKKGWKEFMHANLPVCHQGWKEWIDARLPVGCGVFQRGKEQTLSLSLDRLSDQVWCKVKRSSYLIHPSIGEIWALYKDWDIVRWSSSPEKRRQCKYQIVEVLGRKSKGIRVAYLDKLEGFVSLFQRRSQSEKDSFLIEDKELFRFSHKVPS